MDTTRSFIRVRAEGKFLWVGTQKFFVRGVTYGAFPPDGDGHQFPRSVVAYDFALMQGGDQLDSDLHGAAAALPRSGREYGLRVIINVPWMGHVCFLEQASTRRDARDAVKKAAAEPVAITRPS